MRPVARKIIVFKYKSKKRYRRTQGHRQDHSYLTITDIQANGASLLSEEERVRYTRLAARATRRSQARMAELVETLAYDEAVGDQAAVARDEEAIEQADTRTETATRAKPSKNGKAKK
jgi:large subunit ribosomal protein L21